MPHATASTEEDEFSDESDHKTSLDIISVHQLLESVCLFTLSPVFCVTMYAHCDLHVHVK